MIQDLIWITSLGNHGAVGVSQNAGVLVGLVFFNSNWLMCILVFKSAFKWTTAAFVFIPSVSLQTLISSNMKDSNYLITCQTQNTIWSKAFSTQQNNCFDLLCWFQWIIQCIPLIHICRVTDTCISKLTTIGSDNGLSPSRCLAIIWTNAGILLLRPLRNKLKGNFLSTFIYFRPRKCIWKYLVNILSKHQCAKYAHHL